MQKRTAKMRKVKVGIVSFGRSGRDIHAATLLGMGDKYQITAVSDPKLDLLSDIKAKTGCNTYSDYKALIADKNVELVVVAAPSFLHKEVTIEALKNKKFVNVEKPVAPDVKSVDEMIAASEKYKQQFSVFQDRRFENDVTEVKKIAASGKIGKVYLVKRVVHTFQRRDDWQALKKFGGGLINNHGVHFLDQMLYFANFDIVKFYGDARLLVSAGDAEDYGKIVVVGKDITIDIEVTGAAAVNIVPSLIVFGTQGSIVSQGTDTLKVTYLDPKKLRKLAKPEEIVPNSNFTYPTDKIDWQEEVIKLKNESSFKLYYDAAYEWIVNGKEVPVSPESTRKVLNIIETVKKEYGF